MTQELLYDKRGEVGWITFNRPQARNAMTWAMYDALLAACEEVDRHPDVRVFILRGANRVVAVSNETDVPMDLAALNEVLAAVLATA